MLVALAAVKLLRGCVVCREASRRRSDVFDGF